MGFLDSLRRIFGKKIEEEGIMVERMTSPELVRPFIEEPVSEQITVGKPSTPPTQEEPNFNEQLADQQQVRYQLSKEFKLHHGKLPKPPIQREEKDLFPPFEGTTEVTEQKEAQVWETEPQRVPQDEQSTHMALRSWEEAIVAAKEHPLSQVKIINTKILEEINNVLKSMNTRLDKLDDLEKLDIILDLLQATKEELESKGVQSKMLDHAIGQIDQLTMKDKEVLEWVGRQERVTAQQLASYINLSRSTASFRLNRLEELGALEKEAIGKKIYYKLKKQSA